MAGRSFRSVLLLKFAGGSAYVVLASIVVALAVGCLWLFAGDSPCQRSNEGFSDDGRVVPLP